MSAFEKESVALTRARALFEGACQMKAADFANNGADSGIPLLLVPYRGRSEVAHVFLQGERPNVLAALRGVAAGFTPDAIALVMEAWQVTGGADREINPDTGQAWDARRNDMGDYVARHGRDGLVREGISVQLLTAGGDYATVSATFTVTGGQLRFDETKEHVLDDHEESWRSRGAFPDMLRDGVRAAGRTSVFRAMLGERVGASPEAVLAGTDALAAMSLEGAGVVGAVMLSAGEDEVERREVIATVTGRPWSTSVVEALDDEQRRTGWGA